MAKPKQDDKSETVKHVKGKEATVADISISKAKTKTQEEVSEDVSAIAIERAKGVRIRIKDSGSISAVGWKLGEQLVNSGRAEYVDD